VPISENQWLIKKVFVKFVLFVVKLNSLPFSC